VSEPCLLDAYERNQSCDRLDVRLAGLISEVSEECWCAGWLSDCEHSVWMMVTGVYPSHATTPDGAFDGYKWGMGRVTPQDLAEITRLSAELGAWVRPVRRGLCTDIELVPMTEWLALHDTYKSARAEHAANCGYPWDETEAPHD
jgi:hypothetical protein